MDIIRELVEETSAWDPSMFVNDEFRTMIRESSVSFVGMEPSFESSDGLTGEPSARACEGSSWFDLPEIAEDDEDEPRCATPYRCSFYTVLTGYSVARLARQSRIRYLD